MPKPRCTSELADRSAARRKSTMADELASQTQPSQQVAPYQRRTAEARDSHAVVIGASMAGLLAARVLCNHFAHVTVVERDALPEDVQPRKGVP